jgi:hypothetical protein
VAIVLKLFNLMIKALGPALLRRGVLIASGDWEDFLMRSRPEFWENCLALKLDGRRIHPRGAAPRPWPDSVKWINLKVYESAG